MFSKIILLSLSILPLAAPFTASANDAEPTDHKLAIYLARAAYQELDRSQAAVLRRESERSACNLLGRLFALYSAKDVMVLVDSSKKGADGKDIPIKVEVPVPHFVNSNIDSINICRPNSLWERKPSMRALHAEIERLQK